MSSSNSSTEDALQPTTLQEALNIIKFLKISHKQEVARIKEACSKQAEIIKKLEENRKKELEYLSSELQKYELNLALRTESVKKQLAQKDDTIQKQQDIIDELNKKLKDKDEYVVPEIQVESNSDSGVAMENEELHNLHKPEQKTEIKSSRKCSRRFADPISFLRRVDFSPMKYKPSNKEGAKKKEEKKKTLEVPNKEPWNILQYSNEKATSDEDRKSEDTLFSDETIEPVIIRPKKMNDSMNNHFSDDGSEDTSEEIFDRVMTRSSIRRSVKANPKYKKISRTKSKMLEQVKVNIVD